ncbi:symmetrical bis(5'-nucleosyl)-tetraphosphatase [Algicola sagamiensis]|uniref:symmetrical bis(5'-nucleosyl)-tetraphosphatase n=1 Tax=Algicola sagamiensis TaxID=163869 RepID=UPI00035D0A7F|nr:symmetrical bis(5'-nucleosyl)-tetraphosphatase [Algicola sagamiensis]
MADYIIGDIQGCYAALCDLLEKINFSPKHDTLWCAGDLVARGEDSESVMRLLYGMKSSVRTVLGNHDLHLLALAAGKSKNNPKDKLTPLLKSKKLPEYCDWLRQQPLFTKIKKHSAVLTHAGIYPLWTLKEAEQYAKEAEAVIQNDALFDNFLDNMYGNSPDKWQHSLKNHARLRFIVNSFTRMRFCFSNGALELKNKGTLQDGIESGLIPWFQLREQLQDDSQRLFFGHWAAIMGQTLSKHYIGLDTGCVWGEQLTAYNLDKSMKIQVNAKID